MEKETKKQEHEHPVHHTHSDHHKRTNWVKYLIYTFVIIFICLILIVLGIWGGVVVAQKLRNTDFTNLFKNGTIQTTQTTTIEDEENVVIDIVKKSQDSVVSVAVKQVKLDPDKGVVDQSTNIGTGFVVDKNGLVITNQHVVANNADYKIITKSGKEYDVEKILVDNVNDIALLKVSATDLVPLALGDSDSLEVGQLAVAIGTPLGEYAGTVTSGIVSGLNRTVETSGGFLGSTSKTYYEVIQTDAAINPGNSGGPLINSRNEVIGVNFATTSGADNISFALPVNVVKKRLDEYMKFGKFIMPYMGVEYQMITQSMTLYYKDVVPGALIVRVVPDSPAAKAGVVSGDIITKINGKALEKSLPTVVQGFKVGDKLELEVYRAGKTVKLTVTLGEAS
jgi:serine protease Do